MKLSDLFPELMLVLLPISQEVQKDNSATQVAASRRGLRPSSDFVIQAAEANPPDGEVLHAALLELALLAPVYQDASLRAEGLPREVLKEARQLLAAIDADEFIMDENRTLDQKALETISEEGFPEKILEQEYAAEHAS
jgi:hypothetical protein